MLIHRGMVPQDSGKLPRAKEISAGLCALQLRDPLTPTPPHKGSPPGLYTSWAMCLTVLKTLASGFWGKEEQSPDCPWKFYLEMFHFLGGTGKKAWAVSAHSFLF